MSDYYTCNACGERYGVHDDNHAMYCPGSPDDRIAALEKRVVARFGEDWPVLQRSWP